MPFIPSEAASGAESMNALLQNVGAAPYSAEVGAAQAQGQIAEAQSKQANLEKTRLANLVTQTGMEDDKKIKQTIMELAKTPEWKEASDSDRAKMLGSKYMEAGQIDAGLKALQTSAVFDAKEATAEAKKLDNQSRVIGQAYSSLEGANPEQFKNILARMPKAQRDAIEQQLPGFFQENDPELQKKQLSNLMLNASGQLMQKRMEMELAKTRMLIESKERIAREHDFVRLQLKASPAPEKETSQYNAFTRRTNFIESKYKKPLEKVDTEIETAQAEVDKGRLWGLRGASDETKNKLEATIKKRDDIRRKQLQEQFAAAEELPSGPFRDRVIEQLTNQAEILGPDTAEPQAPKEDKPAPKPTAATPKAPVTSNKYTEQNPAKPTSKEEYDKLPAGSYYMQDGVLKRKKG